MKLRFISLLSCAIVFVSCKVHVTRDIAKQMIEVDIASMNFIDDFIQDKDIVILGEASHGDGRTFKIKSDLVKYLVEEKGFNTLAFEARDFLEMEYIRGNSFLKDKLHENLKEDWVRQWAPWGPAQEIQVLEDVVNSKSIAPIGVEAYSLRSERIALKLIKEKLEEDKQACSLVDWTLLDNLHREIFEESYCENTVQSVQLYASILKKLFNEVSSFKEHDTFTLQLIENAITSAELKFFYSLERNASNLHKVVTLRDTQMSNNLAWYKKRNPEAKIIVWMANFHGAKELSAVTFQGEEDFSYENQKVFGEFVTERYDDSVFSLAFTSSEGKAKMPYNNLEGVEETTIVAPENSLEGELALRDIENGFIDFTILRDKKSYNKHRFHSLMLGHYSLEGSWLKVFDGLFYIKSNHVATPIK